ncbi:MAG: hypothetical protein AMJ84_02655 [Acidithiobacillales bacterium SM23_46]|jgi:hypothetical protein|nr:MAG: hypothetical protein AMJ84_02655 [Acidithiobacillales bacterium SM23_46]
MLIIRRIAKPVSYLVSAGLLVLSLHAPMAHAALVGTETITTSAQARQDRDRIGALLARDEVKAQFVAYGVQPEVVQARVDSLTDQEIHSLAGKLDELPAGGSALGTVLGIALVVFLVLLFTDIMGWTSVFPFTKKGSAR